MIKRMIGCKIFIIFIKSLKNIIEALKQDQSAKFSVKNVFQNTFRRNFRFSNKILATFWKFNFIFAILRFQLLIFSPIMSTLERKVSKIGTKGSVIKKLKVPILIGLN